MIVVVSYPGEEHTEIVLSLLRERGHRVVCLDMAQFPAQTGFQFNWQADRPDSFVIDGPDGLVDLAAAKVVWWRRLRPHVVDNAVADATHRAFAASETAQAVGGMLEALNCHWVNPRRADEAAHHKPFQWSIAGQVGLKVPRTLVTTRPDAARRFVAEIGLGRVVCKAFLAMLEAWRETRLVTQGDLDRLNAVQYAPVIFQEYIEGVDLRITVVGDRIFAAEIDARQTSYPIDMRMVVHESEIKAVTLPPEIEVAILRLQRRLGLVYGAIDMRRTSQGEWKFLEVNPAGQWLFTERRAGLPISQGIADLLCRLDS